METTFKTRINAIKSKGEIQTDRTLVTVPDHNTSMRDILIRYSNGVPINTKQNAVYNPAYTLPELSRLDLTEVDDIKRTLKETENELRNSILDGKDKIKKRKADIQAEKTRSELTPPDRTTSV